MSAYTEIKRQLQAIPIPRALLDLITKNDLNSFIWSTVALIHSVYSPPVNAHSHKF